MPSNKNGKTKPESLEVKLQNVITDFTGDDVKIQTKNGEKPMTLQKVILSCLTTYSSRERDKKKRALENHNVRVLGELLFQAGEDTESLSFSEEQIRLFSKLINDHPQFTAVVKDKALEMLPSVK